VEALEFSMDPSAIPALLDQMESQERRTRPNRGYLKALNRTLGSLTGFKNREFTSEKWTEIWDRFEPRLDTSLEALELFLGSDDPTVRQQSWHTAAALKTPTRQVAEAALAELAVAQDPKWISTLVAYLVHLPRVGRFTRPLVRLLERKEVSAVALRALIRIYRQPGAANKEAWIGTVNQNSYLPPFGDVITPALD
jgi:hypothetical protein